jgi:hypothetical protein
MKEIFWARLLVILSGCSGRSVVQKIGGSEAALSPYSGPACLLVRCRKPWTPFSSPVPWPISSGTVGMTRSTKLSRTSLVPLALILSRTSTNMKIGFFACAKPQVWGV